MDASKHSPDQHHKHGHSVSRQFINPWYHLLLVVLPWLPTVRSERASCQAVDQLDILVFPSHD